MSKKQTVKFFIGDAPKPRFEAGVIAFRSPIPLNVKPGTEFQVQLGLNADKPVTLFGAKHLEAQGMTLLNPGTYDARTPLVARFKTTDGVLIETGETLVRGVAHQSLEIAEEVN